MTPRAARKTTCPVDLDGFQSPDQANKRLDIIRSALGTWRHSEAFCTAMLDGLRRSADPDRGLQNLERLITSAEKPATAAAAIHKVRDSHGPISAVLGGSQFLSELLIRNPAWLDYLVAPAQLRTQRTQRTYKDLANAAIKEGGGIDQCHEALCVLRHREVLRIGTRDLAGLGSTEETAREISDLAQSLIAAAAQISWNHIVARFGEPMIVSGFGPDRPAGMCVLGMGKLGGRELNFSSDIDLIFIYEEEGETNCTRPDGTPCAAITNHEFFTRMGETLVRFLGQRGVAGNLFRVDMRLRPEGETGPLARSLESFMSYLREQARDWERLAYLKARVMAGPSQAAERLYRVIQAFVFSDVDPTRIVAEVQRLKVMIDREVIESDAYHHEVKRGYGGIREIEFVIAAMQIIYGSGHTALRARNCFLAIQRLQEVNLLSEDDARFYLESYEFLRLVEHRLQMAEERQTHTLPSNPEALLAVARSCGFETTEAFTAHYREVTDGVHSRFTSFFEQDTSAADRETSDMMTLLNRQASEEEVAGVLARYGLEEAATGNMIRALAYGTSEIFVSADSQRFFEQMLPSLLRLASRAPAPARVLPRLHSFVLAIKGMTYYYELIAQHPPILRLLVQLFGTSSHFSQSLIAHPEFFDPLLSTQILYESPEPEALKARVMGAVAARRTTDGKAIILRRTASFEILLCALRVILQLRPLPLALRDIATVADVLIDCAMPLAAARAAERLDPAANDQTRAGLAQLLLKAATGHFTIVALGKFGGREISFFSDLDVVFVYSDPGSRWPRDLPAPAEAFTALADGLTYALSENLEGGKIFEIDARLRPHGRNSPLATPLSHYVQYLSTEADVWELMSLTRMRVAWGDPEIVNTLAGAARTRASKLGAAAIRRDASAMRRQLEESVSDTAADNLEFKRSPGGIVDCEFAIQIHDLNSNATLPDPAHPDYFARLATIRQGRSKKAAAFADLALGYLFLRTLETAARLIVDGSASSLPADTELRTAIARFLDFSDPTALERQITETMERVRRAYQVMIK